MNKSDMVSYPPRRWLPRLFVGIAVFAVVIIGQRAYAIDFAGKCDEPKVFSDATVNVVVLPYQNDAVTARPLGPQALRFTVLMQLEVLFSILKYGSVGVTRLVATPRELAAGECRAETVLPKLLGTGPGKLKKGHGLVLVWGSFYEEGQVLYTQTYVRFLRGQVAEQYTLPIKASRFLGRIPVTSVALPPQRVTQQDLDDIAAEFERMAAFHDSPSESSPSRKFPIEILESAHDRFAFWVVDTDREWMKLQSFGRGPSGWVQTGGSQSTFRQLKAPKLSFIEGVVGYLREAAGREGSAPKAPEGAWQSAVRALERFTRDSNIAGESPAMALADCLLGVIRLYGDQPSPNSAEKALPYFRQAVRRMPYSADLRDLELVTQLYLAYAGRAQRTRADQFANAFAQAVALEPDNPTAIGNLISYYQLLLGSGPPPDADPEGSIANAELNQRLAALRAIKLPGSQK